MHFSRMLREGARAEMVRHNMGHANIDVVVTDQVTCLAESEILRAEDSAKQKIQLETRDSQGS